MNTPAYEEWLAFLNKENAKLKKEKAVSDSRSSYYFIYDNVENTIMFINSAFATVTGHDTSKVTSELFVSLMHPEDQGYFFEKEKQGQEFTNKLQYNELFKYVFKYSYRLRKADGTYILILQEYQALELNEEGYWCKSLVTHRVMDHLNPICRESDYKIYDKERGVYLDLTNRYNLTNREFEILELIKEGLTSKQISIKLHISPNTILTHRKNILHKTNTSGFIELIKKLASAD